MAAIKRSVATKSSTFTAPVKNNHLTRQTASSSSSSTTPSSSAKHNNPFSKTDRWADSFGLVPVIAHDRLVL
jgi:hypothetical protein